MKDSDGKLPSGKSAFLGRRARLFYIAKIVYSTSMGSDRFSVLLRRLLGVGRT